MTTARDIENQIGFARDEGIEQGVAQTNKLTPMEKEDYMKSIELTEHERLVLYEGGYEYGREDGLAEGMEKGRIEGLKDTARAMLAKGLDAGIVAECTGLSLEEIKTLGD